MENGKWKMKNKKVCTANIFEKSMCIGKNYKTMPTNCKLQIHQYTNTLKDNNV